jgi:NAD(P)-dependent dehydrogenase (short-subunit alcohol dehydrogenase family)
MGFGAIVVTGASRGIGAAVARLAGTAGYAVAVNFALDQAAGEAVVHSIVSAGGRAIAVRGDVAIEADVVRLFETAERELGRIYGLVNNAAVTGGIARVDAVESTRLARMIAVNVTGTILCSREAVRRMSTRRVAKAERLSISLRWRRAPEGPVSGFLMLRRKAL